MSSMSNVQYKVPNTVVSGWQKIMYPGAGTKMVPGTTTLNFSDIGEHIPDLT